MTSRRNFLGAYAASVFALEARSSRYDEIEKRIAKRDFRDIYREDLPTPCMVVELESLERNLRTMADHCRNTGVQLRGHVKVHKSPEIARRQVALKSLGVTCATVAECELMARSGIKGVLLTRQPTSKNNILRTISLAQQEPTFSTVADDPQVVEWLQDAARAGDVKLRTVVDVYAGLSRHGIEAGEAALTLAKKIDA